MAIDAQDMIDQILREQCVYEAIDGSKSHWFRYLTEVHKRCATSQEDSSKVHYIVPLCHEWLLKSFTEKDNNKLVVNFDRFEKCFND